MTWWNAWLYDTALYAGSLGLGRRQDDFVAIVSSGFRFMCVALVVMTVVVVAVSFVVVAVSFMVVVMTVMIMSVAGGGLVGIFLVMMSLCVVAARTQQEQCGNSCIDIVSLHDE